MIELDLFFEEDIVNTTIDDIDLSKLRRFISFMTMDQMEMKLNYIVVSKSRIIEINKEFLNHDYSTDIITFDLSEDNDTIEGEIYICLDEIIDNAKDYNATLFSEFNRVLVHGFLHLIGYNDTSDEEKKLMKFGEELYLSLLN